MKNQIIEYIRKEKEKLDSGEVKEIRLKNVYPSLLEEVFGDFEDFDDFDVNGWQGDYWYTKDEYKIFGTMYYGTVEIEKRVE